MDENADIRAQLRAPHVMETRRRLGIATPAQIEAGELPGDEEFAAYSAAIRAVTDACTVLMAAMQEAVRQYAAAVDTIPPEMRREIEERNRSAAWLLRR